MKTLSRCFLVLFSCLCCAAAKSQHPNILLIMSDDMGFSDLGCYGGQFAPTPNLNRMAIEGMRFTQFYVAEADNLVAKEPAVARRLARAALDRRKSLP